MAAQHPGQQWKSPEVPTGRKQDIGKKLWYDEDCKAMKSQLNHSARLAFQEPDSRPLLQDLSMADEAADEAVVVVDGITESIGPELLLLYFESRRRSLGGPLRSHRHQGASAVLTFENPEDAQRVLSKGEHLLQDARLSVRRAAPRDPGKVLLHGVKPETELDVLELYVECLTNRDSGEYTLHRSPAGADVLIEFCEPLTDTEFSSLEQKVQRRPLDGFVVSVDRVQRTERVLVRNLGSGIRTDLLELYFESKRSDGGEVCDVSILEGAGAAIITFKTWEVADRVLRRTHCLQDCKLQLSPYYDFLRPPAVVEEAPPPPDPESESSMDPVQSVYINVTEAWKLELLQQSPELRELRGAFPEVSVELDGLGVRLSGQEQEQCQQLQGRVLDFLRGAAQSHIPCTAQTLQFVQRNDMRPRLEELLRSKVPGTLYIATDGLLTVMASSVQAVREASAALRAALCEFSVPVPSSCLSTLHSEAWRELQASLCCCSVSDSPGQDSVRAVCLRDYEQENRQALQSFLQFRQLQETVISMEPAVLRYLQRYNHELLASMAEVTIEPLEGADVTGFRLFGDALVCRSAEELIRDIMNNIGSVPVTLEHPGVSRFLLEERGQTILKDLEVRCQCVISTARLWWAPDETECELDSPLFQGACSFDRCSPDSMELLTETPRVVDTSELDNIKAIVAAVKDDVDEDSMFFFPMPSLGQPTGQRESQVPIDRAVSDELQEEMDLYTDREASDEPILVLYSDEEKAEETAEAEEEASAQLEDCPITEASTDPDPALTQARLMSLALFVEKSSIDEKAEMHLAIQRSVDIQTLSTEEEDRQLKDALERSLVTYQEEQTHDLDLAYTDYGSDVLVDALKVALEVSKEDCIRKANSAQLTIYGSYDKDLRSIADQLRQAVKAKLHMETVVNNCLRDLPEQYHAYLAYLQRKHAVQISIQGGVATIHGFLEYTIYATRDMTKLINRILQDERLKVEEAETSQAVRWVWYDQRDREVPFSTKASAFIERAWRHNQKVLDIVLDNKPYTINFERMEEYSIGSSQTTRIARTEASHSKAESGMAGVSDIKVELVRVDEATEEFRKVIRPFYDTLEEYHNKVKIVKVEKLLNPLLHSQYQLKKQCMVMAGCQEPVERILYHGTSEESAKEICQYGFNRSFCGKNAVRYGQGVYFAVQSVLSVQDFYSPRNSEGNKSVFVVKTLTGDYTQGTQDMKVPPLKKDSQVPLRYDSVVDNVIKPTIFVIFNDTQSYPQYLITCQRN